jgi:hypothetical protein
LNAEGKTTFLLYSHVCCWPEGLSFAAAVVAESIAGACLFAILLFMRVCYGDNSQPTIRAEETAAALQRLKWELERTNLRAVAAA